LLPAPITLWGIIKLQHITSPRGPDRWGRFVVAGVVALSWLLQLRVLASLLRAGLPRPQAVVLLVPLLALSFYGLQVVG